MTTGLPSVDDYYELARRDLPGLFGATIDLVPQNSRQNRLTLRDTPQTTLIRLPRFNDVLRLQRPSLRYTTVEMLVQQSYAAALEDLDRVPRVFAVTAAADLLPRVIAARCASSVPERSVALEELLRAVTDQAAKTYEGVKVAVNICVDLDDTTPGTLIGSFFKESWAAVLGSGLSTALLANGRGEVVACFDLGSPPGATPPSPDLAAPERFLQLAAWTETGNRVAVAATRSGEMYIMVGGECAFVLRSARWRGIPVAALQRSSWFDPTAGMPRRTKRAALRSLIDASAAHHGGCLGIVQLDKVQDVSNVVADEDRWQPGMVRHDLFNTTSFFELSRRQRLELLSMDGATLITTNGEILAAGAIVQVGAGSSGGGRTAAAKALGALGVGIKVSQDGPITAYAGVGALERFSIG